ncbi:hypothetical protein POM88_005997 [Heracleum sosnowskyi]|uniref:Uncharacterized protein n=1 Tax=Heracleum sosnowskyi TaxID=360622 RepID=A0AAD8J3F6_9APIA|nr:hypothetical protein POM88_005997 [Heracleum sosnowskyi]
MLMGLSIVCRRSSRFRAFVKSNKIKFTGQNRNFTIPDEPTSKLLSVEFNRRIRDPEVRSFGLPDVCSAMTSPLGKTSNLINGYGYSRCFGLEEKAKKGPHFGLVLARNYTKKSGEVEWPTNEVMPDFPDLLFTENRDYLVKYNGQRVHADQLAGKGTRYLSTHLKKR